MKDKSVVDTGVKPQNVSEITNRKGARAATECMLHRGNAVGFFVKDKKNITKHSTLTFNLSHF